MSGDMGCLTFVAKWSGLCFRARCNGASKSHAECALLRISGLFATVRHAPWRRRWSRRPGWALLLHHLGVAGDRVVWSVSAFNRRESSTKP